VSLRTRFCELLGVRHPIALAPMAGAGTPELAAAVSRAGGLGMLAGTLLSPQELREAIARVRAATAEPFGVNFLIAPPERAEVDEGAVEAILGFRTELVLPPAQPAPPPAQPPSFEEQLAAVLEERVPLVTVALGDPGQALVERIHAGGALAGAMVTTVDEAVRVEAEGVDLLVAQGAEAGGHRSTLDLAPDDEPPLVGTLALVPQVVDAVSVPVVAAGGIADGRGVAAALALGAQAAQLGTRFLVARESGAHPVWQERLVTARETDTVVTRAYTGRPARSVRNRFAEAFAAEGVRPLPWGRQSQATIDLSALRLLKGGQGAAEIVDELVAQANAVLRRLAP
jgi:nitronate monooxygenase